MAISPPAHGYLGLMKFFLGRARETRTHIVEAMRLSPRGPLQFHWHFFIGVADGYLGRVVHGLASLRRSVEINPNWGLSQFVLAGALALAGLLAEAEEVCAIARRLAPNFTICTHFACTSPLIRLISGPICLRSIFANPFEHEK
jgi:hypothetical protein